MRRTTTMSVRGSKDRLRKKDPGGKARPPDTIQRTPARPPASFDVTICTGPLPPPPRLMNSLPGTPGTPLAPCQPLIYSVRPDSGMIRTKAGGERAQTVESNADPFGHRRRRARGASPVLTSSGHVHGHHPWRWWWWWRWWR